MKLLYKNYYRYILAVFFAFSFFCPLASAEVLTQNATVNTTNVGLTKVAPGELLPISVKLSNFGGGQKVDVTITYGIFDAAKKELYTTTETVAVETTASFIKTVQIPFDTPPGKYSASASIVYEGQLVPATTQFPFVVENKIMGLFLSDFYFYAIVALIISIITGIVGFLWTKKRRLSRLNSFEYPQIASKDRIFYEIISDIIMQMRYRVGDMALDIASHIDNLVIDQQSGKVLEIKANPAKIVASLILNYEKVLGEKVSFAVKKSDNKTNDILAQVDEHLVLIKK